MQDYKHIRYDSEKRKSESKRSRKTSIIFLFGLLALIGAGVFLQKQNVVVKKIEKIVEEKKEALTDTRRFTFYDILARGEIIVDADLPVELKQNPTYIQLGAFKSDIEADNFEARMKLMDLHPQVQSLFLPEKGGHWFIVRIGPIRDDNEMSIIKTQLAQNKVEYAIISKTD